MSTTTDPDAPLRQPQEPQPSVLRWTLGFLLVGMAWGLTVPFMRRAAINYTAPSRPSLSDPNISRVRRLILKVIYTVFDLLRRPAYLIPLLINITGSVWFFLLIGKAELSLTAPISNAFAFLFTVLGEWWAEGKVVTRNTWVGMGMVVAGIGMCVHAKS